MKIISYNVNGIRAAIKKGFFEWLSSENPDIICIQETKSQPEQIDVAGFEALGYQSYMHSAVKKGYSGVATFTKRAPKSVVSGLGIEKYDSEGRVIITHFEDFTLLNCYFPSGSSGEERHAFKMSFLNDLQPWIDTFREKHPNLIVVGDYNIVHTEKDIHNPQRKDKPSGYRPEEREWLSQWYNNGFVDAFRHKNPEEIEFSWWSYRANSRANNKGWRIDYCSVSDTLKDRIVSCGHLSEAKHSDHCPVVLSLSDVT